MAITRRRSARFGTEAADLDTYLGSFKAGGYPVQVVVHPACGKCGASEGFYVLVDDEEGGAVRKCAA